MTNHLKLIKKHTKNIIIGGNMNATIDKDFDRWSNYSKTNETIFPKFEKFAENYIDIWIKYHPNKSDCMDTIKEN
jgi:hypothetical protein